MGATPVGNKDHAQAVLALLLGADAIGLRREEDLPRRSQLPREVCQPASWRLVSACHSHLHARNVSLISHTAASVVLCS